MNWARAIAALLVLWSTSAWSYTLTWTANTDSDLAGYRVYYCSVSDCTKTSGNASLLTTLGMVTSFNIGTPATAQYYFLTAFDFSNNESEASTVATYIPPSSVPPAIGVNQSSFSFAATQGDANSATQTLGIFNTGGGTLSWTLSESVPWLTLSRTSGSGDADITLSVSTGSLAAGSYSGTITINATGASSVNALVTFTVSSAPVPVIEVSQRNFSFAATQGGANPAPQALRISNTGGGTLSWTLSENVPWLTLSRTSGSGDTDVTLTVSTGSLAVGSYSGTIAINATGASSVTVSVAFTVTAGSFLQPVLSVSPTSLSFTARERDANPASQTLYIANTGGGVLYWTVSDNARWLSFSPNNGTQNGTVRVTVTTRYLRAGTYRSELLLWTSGSSTPVGVPVTVTVTR